MKKGILFMALCLSTGVTFGAEAPIDRLADEYYQGWEDALWDASIGFCKRRDPENLKRCTKETFDTLVIYAKTADPIHD